MTSTVDRYADSVGRLAELGFPAPLDPRQEGARNAAAWAQPLGREARQLRIHEDVWARLRAASGHAPTAVDPSARFLPPSVLWGLSAQDLARDEVAAAAQEAVDAWMDVQREHASDPGQLALIEARLGGTAWKREVDPQDDTAAGSDSAETGRALVGIDAHGADDLDAATAGLPFDAAARRELSRFLRALDEAGFDRSSLDVAALLAGLWGGALRNPRVAAEWEAARTRLASGASWSDLRPADVAAARVSLLADNGVGCVDPDAWERLVTWAYARAQAWPRHSTIDPQLHSRLVEAWRADRAAEASLPTGVAGPGLAGAPQWHAFVVEAVSKGRIPTIESEPAPQVARPAPTTDGLLAELDALQGLDDVKARVRDMLAFERMEASRAALGLPRDPISRHLVLVGNPGTGKTTVARLIGRILHAAGALPSSAFHEVRRSDFVGPHRGETETKTRELIDKARGGVLFIDEAYALAADDKDADFILAELVAGMENHRDDLIVIAAGYPGPMARFLDGNPGLKGRFAGTILFPDMDDATLVAAFEQMIAGGGYTLAPGAADAALAHFAGVSRTDHFANAREARNLYDVARQHLATRHDADSTVDPTLLTAADIPRPMAPAEVDETALAVAMASIDSLVGMSEVKQDLHGRVDRARVARARWLQDPAVLPDPPGHLAFVGRPGTGKTTVAQQLGAVYRAMGSLRSGHVVTANRATLVAPYIGQTAPKVRAAVRSALDGILFIDEAYALAPSDHGRDFGHEALATLVEEMEANRGRLVVILAGYPKETERLLEANAGLASRVGTTVTFADYSRAELREIAVSMASARRFELDPEAADRIAEAADAMRGERRFANARTVRNLLDAACDRQARRVAPLIGGSRAGAELSRIRVEDVPAGAAKPEQWGMYL